MAKVFGVRGAGMLEKGYFWPDFGPMARQGRLLGGGVVLVWPGTPGHSEVPVHPRFGQVQRAAGLFLTAYGIQKTMSPMNNKGKHFPKLSLLLTGVDDTRCRRRQGALRRVALRRKRT